MSTNATAASTFAGPESPPIVSLWHSRTALRQRSLLQSFPVIGSLAKVYGAITFYLQNEGIVDAFVRKREQLSEQVAATQPLLPDGLSERLRRTREGATPRMRPGDKLFCVNGYDLGKAEIATP